MLTACVLLYTNGAVGQQQPIDSNTTGTSIDRPPASPAECTIDPKIKQWIKFKKLVDEWRRERGAMSSITEMSMLPPYQKIIGMGPDAISLILAELKSEGNDPDQWFWALRVISEAASETAPPTIKPEDQGNFRNMAQAWFKWAEDEGYAW
jgi:hypothetical protein